MVSSQYMWEAWCSGVWWNKATRGCARWKQMVAYPVVNCEWWSTGWQEDLWRSIDQCLHQKEGWIGWSSNLPYCTLAPKFRSYIHPGGTNTMRSTWAAEIQTTRFVAATTSSPAHALGQVSSPGQSHEFVTCKGLSFWKLNFKNPSQGHRGDVMKGWVIASWEEIATSG